MTAKVIAAAALAAAAVLPVNGSSLAPASAAGLKVAGPANAMAAATVPSPPVIRPATAGNASAVANWTAPSDVGGSEIVGYHVRVVDGATGKLALALRDAAAGATSLTFPGLTNGRAVRIQVQAWNATGMSGVSAHSNAVTPATKPGSPKIAAATAGNASAVARWAAPANGGSVILGYHVRVVDAATGKRVVGLRDTAANATSLNFTGLTPRAAVRFQVQAWNAKGMSGASSHSNAVTPAAGVVTAPASYTVNYTTLGNGKKVVTRWNPCRSHTYKVNLAAVPAASRPTLLAETHTAMGVLTAKSGIPFVYQGATTEVPQPGSHASQSAELIIAYTTPDKTSYPLSGSTAGVGGAASKWTTTYSGTTPTYTGGIYRGFVVIDTPQALLSYVMPGFGTGMHRGNVLLHELGHAVGLGHVSGNPGLLMSTSMTSRTPNGFAPGDLAGLAVVGRPAGCIPGM
jgi:Fibronectin type III domain